ncbi:MAG: hypothetical protein MJ102_07430 [Clostridia bacterium]|nr:hypothetical protein [Clostridia bacterium]
MKKTTCLLCIVLIIMSILTSCDYVAANVGSTAGSASEQDSAESDELPEEISLDPKYRIYRADELELETHEIDEQLEKEQEESRKAFNEFAKTAGNDDAVEVEILGEKYTLMPNSGAMALGSVLMYRYTSEKVDCFISPVYGWEGAVLYEWSNNERNRLDALSTVSVDNAESAREIADKYITEKAFPGIDLTKFNCEERTTSGYFIFYYVLKAGYAYCDQHSIIIFVDRYGVVYNLNWIFTAGKDREDSEKNLIELSKTFPDQKIVEDEMIKRYRKDNALPDDVECKTRGHSFSVLNDGRYAISCVVYNGDRGAEYYIVWSPYKE